MKRGLDMRKVLALIAVIAVLIAFLPFNGFAEASDNPYKGASSWAVAELDKAVGYGFITDKIKDKMSAPITREEFAEIAVRLYEKYSGLEAQCADANTFTDTKNPEILKAFKLKIVNGTDMNKGLFSPNQLTNREQVATMVYRAVKAMKPDAGFSTDAAPEFSDEKQISSWAVESVRFMNSNGFIKGSGGRFDPKGDCTREMAVIIVKRVYEKYSSANAANAVESSSLNNESGTGTFDLEQIVINDFEYHTKDFRVKEKEGSSYIFINVEKLKFGVKCPYAGYYAYPDVVAENGGIVVSWKNEDGIILQVGMREGSTEALLNGQVVDMGMAPYSENGKTFIPINLFIAALEMEVEAYTGTNTLFIQYKNDFPTDILAGTWSDVNTDLFIGFKDIVTGYKSLSSFATAYKFEKDGTYKLRMVAVGGFNDTLIAQTGKYKVMGNTIMFYDIVETLYKGNPFTLVYEDKHLESPGYSFIFNYNSKENKIEIGATWLNKRQ